MPNVIAKIEKYLTNAIDTVFAQDSATKILENGQKFIDVNFKETGYVKVMSILMDGLSDYYRVNSGDEGTDYTHYPQGDGYKVGNVKSEWEIFKLEYDRGKQFQVDNMDDEESAGMIIGNLLTEFLRTKVVPEVDAVRFSKLAGKATATLGNLKTAYTIEDNEVLKEFNSAYEWLFENEVPEEDQVIFVNPALMTKIRNSTELTKYLGQSDFKSGNVTFTLQTFENRPIIVVPSSRFYTDVVVGTNGFHPSANSKTINYMIVSKKAVVPIVKLNKSKIWTPDTVQDFDGYKVNFRMYHDVIVPKNKLAGVYVSVGNIVATTKSNILKVDVVKDGDNHIVNEYFTTPAGILGAKLVHATSAFALGTTYASANEIKKGVPFTKLGATEYYALLDTDNRAIAVSTAITLPTA